MHVTGGWISKLWSGGTSTDRAAAKVGAVGLHAPVWKGRRGYCYGKKQVDDWYLSMIPFFFNCVCDINIDTHKYVDESV